MWLQMVSVPSWSLKKQMQEKWQSTNETMKSLKMLPSFQRACMIYQRITSLQWHIHIIENPGSLTFWHPHHKIFSISHNTKWINNNYQIWHSVNIFLNWMLYSITTKSLAAALSWGWCCYLCPARPPILTLVLKLPGSLRTKAPGL